MSDALSTIEPAIDAPSAEAHPSAARGYLLASTAAVLWGFSGVVTKFLLRRKMMPEELLLFRTLFASLLMFFGLRLTAPRLLRVQRSDLRQFILLALLGLVTSQGFYYFALSYTSVGIALLIQYQAPVLLMAYGVLTGTERMSPGKLLAAALAIGGCALMVFGQPGGLKGMSLPGLLFAFGSAFGFAFYSGYGKHSLKRYDPRTMLTYAFMVSTIVWMLRLPPWRIPWAHYDLGTLAFFVYLAAVATVLPFLCYFASLRYLEPSRSSLTTMLEPVVAMTVAWLWLGESMTLLQFLGGAGVLAGVFLLQLESLLHNRLKGTTENAEMTE